MITKLCYFYYWIECMITVGKKSAEELPELNITVNKNVANWKKKNSN